MRRVARTIRPSSAGREGASGGFVGPLGSERPGSLAAAADSLRISPKRRFSLTPPGGAGGVTDDDMRSDDPCAPIVRRRTIFRNLRIMDAPDRFGRALALHRAPRIKQNQQVKHIHDTAAVEIRRTTPLIRTCSPCIEQNQQVKHIHHTIIVEIG